MGYKFDQWIIVFTINLIILFKYFFDNINTNECILFCIMFCVILLMKMIKLRIFAGWYMVPIPFYLAFSTSPTKNAKYQWIGLNFNHYLLTSIIANVILFGFKYIFYFYVRNVSNLKHLRLMNQCKRILRDNTLKNLKIITFKKTDFFFDNTVMSNV